MHCFSLLLLHQERLVSIENKAAIGKINEKY